MRVFDFVSFLTYVSFMSGFNGHFVNITSNWEMVLTHIRNPDEIDAAHLSSHLKILLNARSSKLVRPTIDL